jgi:putative Holliday junction resolvase
MVLPSGRRVALDFGSARVGIAATDRSGIVATPLPAVHPDLLIETLTVLEGSIAVIYLGNPLHLSGAPGTTSQSVRDVATKLQGELNAPIRFVDERLTTKSAAERVRREPGLKSFAIDSIAALEILEFALAGEARKGGFFGEAL